MNKNNNYWLILICIGLITFMTDLDASIVNIALPVINNSLSITMSTSELLVSIYLITICVFLLPFGKVGDKFGKIKLFKLGMIIFTVGSGLCGISSTIYLLLASRFIQAIGAAITMSTNNGIITEVFPKSKRGQALGWIGSFVALGMIAGPGIGGLILNILPWQSIFWINVPIGFLMILMGVFVFPKNEFKSNYDSFDLKGNCLIGTSITSFFIYIYGSQQYSYTNFFLLLILMIAIISLYLFIINEIKIRNPLINLKIFKKSNFSIGIVTAVIIFTTNNFYMVLSPFYLENARHLSTDSAGLLMMCLPVVQIIVSPLSGRLSDQFGTLKISILGLFIILIANISLSFINLSSSLIYYATIISLLGLGNALFQSPNNTMIMSSVSSNELGIAGSINSLSRNMGMVLGNAAATSILFLIMSHILSSHITNFDGSHRSTYIMGQQSVYLIGCILVLLAVLLTVYKYLNFQKKEKLYNE